jgi:spore germination protein KC
MFPCIGVIYLGQEGDEKMIRSILFVFFLSFILILTSCGYKDIDKRFFVVSIGVDMSEKEDEDQKYKVHLKLAIPSEDIKKGQEGFLIVSEETDSISNAVRMIKSEVDKELDFSLAKMIVFGEDVVKKDLEKLLDWFIRRRDIQKIAWVGIGKPSAEEILSMKPESERLPANAFLLFFDDTGTESPYIVSEQLFHLRKLMTLRGKDPILPVIEINEHSQFTINTAGVFDKDTLKLILSKEETKVFNLLSNRAQKADLKVKSGEGQGGMHYYVSIDEVDTKFNIKTPKGKKPAVHMEVKLEGIIEESIAEISPEDIDKLEKMGEQEFKKRAEHLLQKLQKANVDPIGFGLKYRAMSRDPRDWEEWRKLYPDVDFELKIDLTIQGTGLLR